MKKSEEVISMHHKAKKGKKIKSSLMNAILKEVARAIG